MILCRRGCIVGDVLITSSTRSIYSSTHRDPLKHFAFLLSKGNQFSYAARPVASARCAARRTARRAARRRLLLLRRACGFLGTSRGLSHDSSLTTSPHAGSSSTTSPMPRVQVPRHVARLVVDYFTYVARPVASARRAACRVTHRRLLRLTQARRRLLHLEQARHRLFRLRRASGCFGTSRGSLRGSSSTNSPTSRVRLLRHIA
jgi:hypothetical protein